MDFSPSPDNPLDALPADFQHFDACSTAPDTMAVAVQHNPHDTALHLSHPNPHAQSVPAVTKRYRPAPAKTFQCRGYGDCRMVFSRSEHLARHIRKHTGERPFTCHCGKQFSRLDNLRQHAQTVHADKQDQNEHMMRDLTTLHASMAAANKVSISGASPAIHFGFSDPPRADAGPGSSSSRSSIAGGLAESNFRSLPPLAAVVSASIPTQHVQSFSAHTQSSHNNVFSFPGSLAFRRPPTAPRPGTAPASASFFPSKSSYSGNGMVARPDISVYYGRGPDMASQYGHYDAELSASPSGHESPFYYQPPGIDSQSSPNSSSPIFNTRKRTYGGSDGTYHDPTASRPDTLSLLDYDYGSESRPQSRRLSVMELCNDPTANAALTFYYPHPVETQ